jgi:hypothetical protein
MGIFNFSKSNQPTQPATTSAAADEDILLELLILIEKANHYVKEGDWNYQDKNAIYALKDRFLIDVCKHRPDGVEIELLYVPYFRYSRETKDRAGDMMRRDVGGNHPFEYYLGQVPPSPMDYEVAGAGNIEILITYKQNTWCFHGPESMAAELHVEVAKLPRKEWVNQRDFHAMQAKTIIAEAQQLLSKLEQQQ